MNKLFFIVITTLYSFQLQSDIHVKPDVAIIESGHDPFSLDKKTQTIAFSTLQMKNKSLNIQLEAENHEHKKLDILCSDYDFVRSKISSVVAVMSLQKEEQLDKHDQKNIKKQEKVKLFNEFNILDIDVIVSQIAYVFNTLKESCIAWITTDCDGDDVTVQRVQDVMHDGRLCEQYLYIDKNNQCTGQTLIPYDKKNTAQCPDAYFIHFHEPVLINRSATDFKQFATQHENFVDQKRYKARVMNSNQFTHELDQLKNLVQHKHISEENYYKYCQEVVREEAIFKKRVAQLQESQKIIQERYKSENPGFVARKIGGISPADTTNYNEKEVNSAITILEAEQLIPKSQKKHIVEESRHIVETVTENANQKNSTFAVSNDSNIVQDLPTQSAPHLLVQQQDIPKSLVQIPAKEQKQAVTSAIKVDNKNMSKPFVANTGNASELSMNNKPVEQLQKKFTSYQSTNNRIFN